MITINSVLVYVAATDSLVTDDASSGMKFYPPRIYKGLGKIVGEKFIHLVHLEVNSINPIGGILD